MALSTATIDSQISSNNTIIANYQAILGNDTLAQSTYALLGESVSFNEWRMGLVEIVDKLVDLNTKLSVQRNKISPYIYRTRYIVQ